jgi:hypothetical protein
VFLWAIVAGKVKRLLFDNPGWDQSAVLAHPIWQKRAQNSLFENQSVNKKRSVTLIAILVWIGLF